MTGPGLALLIVVPLFLLAALRKAAQVAQGRGLLPGRLRESGFGSRGAGATATEELHALIHPSKRVQLEQRRIQLVLRDDEQDGAPKKTGIDLDSGTAHIRKR
ncbi:hypothetical protein GCM10010329_44480 [Streptomyces spiroverticillatus]|uniref:Uncharacterized protein n=1 Tax=Streptomyces finlayi TaxID=67296 RepID=A0A918WZN9_9ACTN|nr:DUF6191 domain-containing protein [Streptomyces finlayi]GHA16659.1 hypothetical protein GCM10010329_44480 [Streptomyces spiroverticillatus]GHC98819.1 hypothetical protein GCM10010334_41660 [Streptomyces finlayi]